MTKKAKKHDFLVDFVTERKYLPSFVSLMSLERGVFYLSEKHLPSKTNGPSRWR